MDELYDDCGSTVARAFWRNGPDLARETAGGPAVRERAQRDVVRFMRRIFPLGLPSADLCSLITRRSQTPCGGTVLLTCSVHAVAAISQSERGCNESPAELRDRSSSRVADIAAATAATGPASANADIVAARNVDLRTHAHPR